MDEQAFVRPVAIMSDGAGEGPGAKAVVRLGSGFKSCQLAEQGAQNNPL